jgi:hypothetical protein
METWRGYCLGSNRGGTTRATRESISAIFGYTKKTKREVLRPRLG